VSEKLQEQLQEMDEQISVVTRDRDGATQETQRLIAALESSKEEVKEVLQALEELAVNFDQKSQDLAVKERENETLLEDLRKKQVMNLGMIDVDINR